MKMSSLSARQQEILRGILAEKTLAAAKNMADAKTPDERKFYEGVLDELTVLKDLFDRHDPRIKDRSQDADPEDDGPDDAA